MVAEFAFGVRTGRNVYRLNDAVGSLTAGHPQPGLRRLLAGAERRRSTSSSTTISRFFRFARRLARLGRRGRRLRLLLLLEPPHRPRGRPVLGGACRPSPERPVQPLDRAPADRAPAACSAGSSICRWRSPACRRSCSSPPASSTSSTSSGFTPNSSANSAGSKGVRFALEPPRPSRRQRPVPRQELRRHLHPVGPPVRHLRAPRSRGRCSASAAAFRPSIRSGRTSPITGRWQSLPARERPGGQTPRLVRPARLGPGEHARGRAAAALRPRRGPTLRSRLGRAAEVLVFAALIAMIGATAAFLAAAPSLAAHERARRLRRARCSLWAMGALLDGRIANLEALFRLRRGAAHARPSRSAGASSRTSRSRWRSWLLIASVVPRRPATIVKRLVLGALAASLVGDVLLLSPSLFLPGLVAFLVAQILYVLAFARGVGFLPSRLGAAGVAIFCAGVLAADLAGDRAGPAAPVAAYVAMLGLMVAQAIGRATVAWTRSAGPGRHRRGRLHGLRSDAGADDFRGRDRRSVARDAADLLSGAGADRLLHPAETEPCMTDARRGVCVVIGAGDGLGAAIARAFAREGLRRRHPPARHLDECRRWPRIRAEGGEAHAFGLDARKGEPTSSPSSTRSNAHRADRGRGLQHRRQRALSRRRDDGAGLYEGVGDGGVSRASSRAARRRG